MILLLDTNAFIWSMADVSKLGKRSLADIANRSNQVYISNISLLECAIKVRTGKLKLTMDFSVVEAFLEQTNIQQLPFDVWVAERYIKLPQLLWADPFDTAIIAQAIAKRMTLVTSDHHILDSTITGLHTLDAGS
jgi:PIN domain nuclease of toxin-antitoxin system